MGERTTCKLESLRAWFLLLALFSALSLTEAQEPPPGGLHYFAIENLATHRFEQRGTTGASGIATENVFLAPNSQYRAWLLRASDPEE